MINTIKNKYNTFIPGEFLPIYIDGKLANRNAFHAYKLKKVAVRAALNADHAFQILLDRAYAK
jgi:hypothetical protein